MKTAHARLARAPAPETPRQKASDRRREPRVKARYHAMLLFSDGACEEVQLVDVSMHGCCVSGNAGALRIGRFVSIGIEDAPMLQAVIRWVRDGTAGMEFLRPIPPERLEWHELMEVPL